MDELSIVGQLLQVMADSADADDFCRDLANLVLSSHHLAAAYVAVLESDGRVTMVGSWGYPLSRRAPDDRPSLWYPMAITDTIRTGEIRVFDTWDAYRARYPHLELRAGPGQSFVCVPFTSHGRRTGGLGLTFNKPLSEVGLSPQLWPILADAANVLITRSWATTLFSGARTKSAPSSDSNHAGHVRESLTAREIQVLQMVASGMTTKEVSHQLHLSPSTIKQTRMSLYRKLGVRRRVDLEYAARALSLDAPVGTAP